MKFIGFDQPAYVLGDEIIVEGQEYPVGRLLEFEDDTNVYICLQKGKTQLECSDVKVHGFGSPEIRDKLEAFGFKSPYSAKHSVFFVLSQEQFESAILRPYIRPAAVKPQIVQSAVPQDTTPEQFPGSISTLQLQILKELREVQATQELIIRTIEMMNRNIMDQQAFLNKLFPQE